MATMQALMGRDSTVWRKENHHFHLETFMVKLDHVFSFEQQINRQPEVNRKWYRKTTLPEKCFVIQRQFWSFQKQINIVVPFLFVHFLRILIGPFFDQ